MPAVIPALRPALQPALQPATMFRRGGGVPPAIYVDSVSGSDSNSGLSAAAPKLTLAAAITAAAALANPRILLARGSQWREALGAGSLTAPVIGSYGAGNLPIVRGDDVITGWAKTAGLTNVYQVTLTHGATGLSRVTVYEDGVRLTRVTSNAACDALPGSWVDIYGATGSPATLKIHATGSGNPASNGKVYEATTRLGGVSAGAGCRVSDVQTMRVISNNGATDIINAIDVGAIRILTLDGTKHNMCIGDGFAEDCIAFGADALTSYEPGSAAFTAFMADATGRSFRFERCGILECIGSDFDAHGAPNTFASGLIRQCWTVGVLANDRFSSVGRYMVDTSSIPGDNLSMCQAQMNGGGASALTGEIADTVIRTTNKSFSTFWRNDSGTLTNCAMIGGGSGSSWFGTGGVASLLTVNRTIFFGGVNMIILDNGSTYAGNYNIFYAEAGTTMYFNLGASLKSNLAAWQTATSQDAQSVYVLPADQVAGGANALWLAYAQAAGGTSLSTIGPAVGDCRINPNARVYSGSGTAYIGTFPDGTLLTTAGPRNHWDWNQRAQVSGPPLRWPTVPLTLAESKTYVNAPAGWDFYP